MSRRDRNRSQGNGTPLGRPPPAGRSGSRVPGGRRPDGHRSGGESGRPRAGPGGSGGARAGGDWGGAGAVVLRRDGGAFGADLGGARPREPPPHASVPLPAAYAHYAISIVVDPDRGPSPAARPWHHSDLRHIALSAFFADLGYQAVLALFPLYLVLHLGAPVWLFGLSQALAYGPGALFGWFGGRWGDRYGRRKIALLGNAGLPLLALIGFASTPAVAIALLAVGWWARNLRSPPRRAMVTECVPPPDHASAFGFLHALDVGGGMLAAGYAFVLLVGGVPYSVILFLTALPLVVSTLVLLPVRVGRHPMPAPAPPARSEAPEPSRPSEGQWLVTAVLAATVLYGFASYSIGFPVLTTAVSTGRAALGVLVFVAFLGASALTGLGVGRLRTRRIRWLALGGYGTAALGSAVLALGAAGGGPLPLFLAGAALLGIALGVVETLEPTLIAFVSAAHRRASDLARLTAFRSLGLFVANLFLGLLYVVSPAYPYLYALTAAAAAATLLLGLASRIGRTGDLPAPNRPR